MQAISQNFNKFCEYACILDLIFNEGEASYNIMKYGRKKNTILIYEILINNLVIFANNYS